MAWVRNIPSSVARNLFSLPGWRTRQRIVVIESDDWGSVRMPSKEAFERLLGAGIRVDQCHYCRLDSLETEQDLTKLFEVLDSVRDINGHPVVLTANVVVANPDFSLIKDSGFSQYSYRTIPDCYREHKGCENSLRAIETGIDAGLMCVQSHGREHLNVKRWLRYLRMNDAETCMAFRSGVFGLSTTITSRQRGSFLAAFEYDDVEQESYVNSIARDGLNIFRDLFGSISRSFIAPNYAWGESLEKTVSDCGVRYIQGLRLHRYCSALNSKKNRHLRYFGRTNRYGQLDLTRNAFFEPAENPNLDWIDHCLAGIQRAFRWKHPAVIATHRVNFMGSLVSRNRDENLRLLGRLLQEVMKRWPNVEFFSSAQLGELIESTRQTTL